MEEQGMKVLLTGAGFTKDFGGFLAREMWDFIFNSRSLDGCPRIKDILRNDFSYESVYHEVLESERYCDEEKNAIKEAVGSAYDRMDENIRGYFHNTANRTAESTSVTNFIKRFAEEGSSGYFFTLNQDLFVERYRGNTTIDTPGITLHGIGPDNLLAKKENMLNEDEIAKTFEKDHPNNPLGHNLLHYIKMHGSYHWTDSHENTNMVIGKNKSERISREPLLRKYSELFRDILSSGNVALFVIGYGFGDEHINEVIADSVENKGLDLHVMNPDSPERFQDYLREKPHCANLWATLKGYYPYSVSKVSPPDQNAESQTVEYRRIMESFFGIRYF